MFPLLQRCLEFNEEAWGDLYQFVKETTSPSIRWVLRRFGVSRAETEVVVLELFAELYLNDFRKLRSCRAQNDEEFRAWLWQVAAHFAQDWVRRGQHAQTSKEVALSRLGVGDRSGPDEHAMRARVEEWRPLMAPRDFDRLLILIGWATPEPAVRERTQRRWTQQLLDKYPNLFGDGG